MSKTTFEDTFFYPSSRLSRNIILTVPCKSILLMELFTSDAMIVCHNDCDGKKITENYFSALSIFLSFAVSLLAVGVSLQD